MDLAIKLSPATEDQKTLLAKVEKEAGTSVNLCYQCGKCTAGCPAAFAMDYPPRQVIRLLQLGMIEQALQAESIWICASCETCSARCPRGVDIASLMDTMRRQALKQGKADKRVAAFNKAFLSNVKNFGKTYEAGLLLRYNLTTGQLFKDMELGLPMMIRGKVGVLPERIKAREEMKKIFERAEKLGGDE
ncbi:MAG: 4Fe-4S dicluster domain-containing protein [Syntrophomonadaceae bacterium]|nr:4Fe-4S dicluster domain-containing protein [Syntrophomonadaceae bacterium]